MTGRWIANLCRRGFLCDPLSSGHSGSQATSAASCVGTEKMPAGNPRKTRVTQATGIATGRPAAHGLQANAVGASRRLRTRLYARPEREYGLLVPAATVLNEGAARTVRQMLYAYGVRATTVRGQGRANCFNILVFPEDVFRAYDVLCRHTS
ncbi:hypothetical protein AB0N05_02990 [Nocardia sp. NPDC051030]|uniref:hypothetical protein n=1 Tax=Nocardia sp. NPDC051030 TaxID=3155162 RepID=UPI00342F5BFA